MEEIRAIRFIGPRFCDHQRSDCGAFRLLFRLTTNSSFQAASAAAFSADPLETPPSPKFPRYPLFATSSIWFVSEFG